MAKKYICIKQCYHNRQRFNPGDPLIIVKGKSPGHFVTEDEYLGITNKAEKKRLMEEEKNTREALRESAADPEAFKEHTKVKTPNFLGPIKELYCPLCDQDFTSKDGQVTHMINRHPDVKVNKDGTMEVVKSDDEGSGSSDPAHVADAGPYLPQGDGAIV
tara:strand:- start:324 stop:803 length:480 start_codon:yes stop_codon:yes gene_type:complete